MFKLVSHVFLRNIQIDFFSAQLSMEHGIDISLTDTQDFDRSGMEIDVKDRELSNIVGSLLGWWKSSSQCLLEKSP